MALSMTQTGGDRDKVRPVLSKVFFSFFAGHEPRPHPMRGSDRNQIWWLLSQAEAAVALTGLRSETRDGRERFCGFQVTG